MSKGTSGKASRLARCMHAPLRILRNTRDLYAKSVARCTGRAPVRSSVFPSGASRGGEDRPTKAADAAAAAPRAAAAAVPPAEKPRPLDPRRREEGGGRAVTRSRSVAVGRIDEDEPSDFFDPEKVESDLLLLRSKSLAVELRRRGSRTRRTI